MSRANFLFTSESVSEGHPDKVSDQISDAILDAFIEKDIKLGIADDSQINTRLGCETLCTTNKIVVAGEGRGQLFKTIHGVSVVDRELITEIARGVVKDIGYDQNGFSYHGADVEVLLHGQSPDIAMGVNAKKKKGRRRGRRRRPGHDVRLRLHRERSVREGLLHAGADLLRPQDPEGAVGQAPRRPAFRSAAGRQEPGHRAIRQRQAGRLHQGRGLDAAQREEPQQQEIHAGHGQGADRATRSSRRCRRAGCRRSRPTSWSTRPATSWSADRTATAA